MSQTEIPLSRGCVALVDDGDYEMLSAFKWHVVEAGSLYAVRNETHGGARKTSMHRFLMLPAPDEVVDHINGDGLDNRRSNLRVCIHQQNCSNQPRHRHSTSPFKGVNFDPVSRNWRAHIGVDGKLHHLGRHPTAEAAARAYDVAARAAFGPFAKTNFGGEA